MGDPFEEGKDYYLLFLVQGKAMELWLIRSSAVSFLSRDFFLPGLILEMREKNELCVIVALKQKIVRSHCQKQDPGSLTDGSFEDAVNMEVSVEKREPTGMGIGWCRIRKYLVKS